MPKKIISLLEIFLISILLCACEKNSSGISANTEQLLSESSERKETIDGTQLFPDELKEKTFQILFTPANDSQKVIYSAEKIDRILEILQTETYIFLGVNTENDSYEDFSSLKLATDENTYISFSFHDHVLIFSGIRYQLQSGTDLYEKILDIANNNENLTETVSGEMLFSQELTSNINKIIFYSFHDEEIVIEDPKKINLALETLQSLHYSMLKENEFSDMDWMDFVSEDETFRFGIQDYFISFGGQQYESLNAEDLSSKLIEILEIDKTISGERIFTDEIKECVHSITFYPFDTKEKTVIEDPRKIQNVFSILQAESYLIRTGDEVVMGMDSYDFSTENETYGFSVSTSYISFEGTQYEAVSGTDLSASIFEILEIDLDD